ncbi:hypothetical protein SVIOM74S_10192 [Streptomyces violarus]
MTIAKGLATVGAERLADDLPPNSDPGADLIAAALTALLDDPDALVRAAAYGALGTTGCPASLTERAVAALSEQAWRVSRPPRPCPSSTPRWPSPPSPRPSRTPTPMSARPPSWH